MSLWFTLPLLSALKNFPWVGRLGACEIENEGVSEMQSAWIPLSKVIVLNSKQFLCIMFTISERLLVPVLP